MKFEKRENSLFFSHKGEKVLIEPWGRNALRVRATRYATFTGENMALEENIEHGIAKICIDEKENGAEISNGRMKIRVASRGFLTFYRDDTEILREYYRNYDFTASDESICLKLEGRS